MIFLGHDLKYAASICDPARNSLVGGIDEPGQTRVRASDAAFAADNVSSLLARYGEEHKVKTFSCLDQYLEHSFG